MCLKLPPSPLCPSLVHPPHAPGGAESAREREDERPRQKGEYVTVAWPESPSKEAVREGGAPARSRGGKDVEASHRVAPRGWLHPPQSLHRRGLRRHGGGAPGLPSSGASNDDKGREASDDDKGREAHLWTPPRTDPAGGGGRGGEYPGVPISPLGKSRKEPPRAVSPAPG